MTRLESYFALVDILRESRRAPGWRSEDDRPLLDQLADAYEQLTPADRDSVEVVGWRAWSDQFDAKLNGAP